MLDDIIRSGILYREYVNLSSNRIDYLYMQKIADILINNKSIKVLNLFYNNLGDSGSLVVSKLCSKISIKKIDLSWNGIGNVGLLEIIEMLKINNSIIEINLSHNVFDKKYIDVLIDVIKYNTSIINLQLEGIQITTNQNFEINSYLARNKSS